MPRWAPRGARKLFHDRDAGETEGKAAKAGFTFSWPVLGALALFLIGAVVWSFIMGFMVGQGHNPNSKIQEITGLSLSAESDKSVELERPAEEASDNSSQPSKASETEETNPPPAPKPTQEAAFRVPKGNELAAWGEAPKKAAPPPPKKEKASPAPKEALFDFTFQIAAFKNKTDAENLQKKLTAINVKTKIQKSGAVQLLITQIRGNASVPDKLRQKLVSLKLGKPLQLSKKALSTSTKRNK